ncbi:hypothetical protein [Candidatus Uabimicrobium sp. HlEnr_7]|uniref:hypothetical protein n=1 Tax=Candidatus Uabimicrobium helgolandensis TaxID=3095367 RepID=UPI003556A705
MSSHKKSYKGARPKNKFSKYGKPQRRLTNKRRKTKIPDEVKEISTTHNLGIYTALSIYRNKISLEDAIAQKKEKDIRKEKAQKMCDAHPEITLALACSLIKDNISIEEHRQQKLTLEKKRLDKEMQKKLKMQNDNLQKDAFSQLSKYMEKDSIVVIEKYKNKYQTVRIKNFTPYEFFAADRKDNIEKIHRLEIKYMYERSIQKTLKKFIMVDKDVQRKRLKPTHSRDGRFSFSKEMLQQGNEVILSLHEGEMLRGTILWSTPYDIMLNLANNRVWVFQHAVANCSLMRKA